VKTAFDRSERVLGLRDTSYMYVMFRVKDPRGAVVSNAPFWIDVYAPPGYNASYEYSYRVTTDDQGLLEVNVPSSEFKERKVSITPLLQYPDGPVNRAIIWQVPFTFSSNRSSVVDIVLKPGGGLNEQPSAVAPPPSQSFPANPQKTPVSSGVDKGIDPSWILALTGVGTFVAAYFLIPVIMNYWKARRTPNG
jgi:hypothetical protein